MKHKTIGQKSARFLESLAKRNQQIFITKEAAQITGASLAITRDFLNELVARGLILRVKPGKFYVIPYDQDAETYMPNWHIIASHLINSESYIGYYSALEIYELITQPSLTEYLVINSTVAKSAIKVKDISFKFIYHNDKHFFGFDDAWIDAYHQVKVSDLEKTFIDCIFKPEYAGGMIEIFKALDKAKNKIDWNKLKKHLSHFDSKAVNKRLGYMLELLDIEQKIQKYLQRKLGKSHTILDPSIPNDGVYISKWKIYANIDESSMLNALYT